MDIVTPKNWTRVLKAPSDWNTTKNGSCDPLPVIDTVIAGLPYMFSFWKPSQEELDSLNKGHAIALGVVGSSEDAHPVVTIAVSGEPADNLENP